jgi:hypothetical protein
VKKKLEKKELIKLHLLHLLHPKENFLLIHLLLQQLKLLRL